MNNILEKNKSLLDSMCPNERFKFEQWIDELNRVYQEAEGDKFGDGRVEESTGLNYWLDYFVEGKSAREALIDDAVNGLIKTLS